MSARRPRIRLSREADQDLADIGLYTRREWGREQYAHYSAALRRALRSVRDHPHLGQARDDLFPGCRGFNVEQHVIYYKPEPGEIVVLRILHSRQDPAGKVEELPS
jgi:toxin ParE1/3/4